VTAFGDTDTSPVCGFLASDTGILGARFARFVAGILSARQRAVGRLIGVLLLAVTGCTESSDTRVVDFSRTIEVARPASGSPERSRLRVAVGAMVSPKETFVHYRELLEYIAAKMGKEVELVQRRTYGEINDLLGKGEIDLAFVCSGPYALEEPNQRFELLATPEVNGSHFYQAYLIVNENSAFTALEDLRGRTFAFTDPDSNTGKLVPTHWLAKIHETPESFFRTTIYTYSHDNAIMAVGKGLVDGASVDGLIWEFYHKRNPTVTGVTRVIRKSEPYGIPPLVASGNLPEDIKQHVRQLLFSMHQDGAGKRILDHLMIDRFVEPHDEWYDGIRALIGKPVSESGIPHEPQKS
jgi:phosphonate transport system substrate-binding protein